MKKPKSELTDRQKALKAFSAALLELASTQVYLERANCPPWVCKRIWECITGLRRLRMAAEDSTD